MNPQKMPKHIAIIMDGNGRWAKERGEHRLFGHSKGVETVKEVIKAGVEYGIQYLTLYAFSTENWNRPQEEVNGLMNLLVDSLTKELDEFNKEGIKLMFIGNFEGLPERCKQSLKNALEKTINNTKMNVVVAINYSSKLEILQAVKNIVQKGISSEEITEDMINQNLWTKNIPEPELLIRTSGEHRISNFLLWQLAYSELYFSPIYWPDFNKDNLKEAIIAYQNRERRFGLVSEQIKN